MKFTNQLTLFFLLSQTVFGLNAQIKRYIVAFNLNHTVSNPIDFLHTSFKDHGVSELLKTIKIETEIKNVFEGFVAYLPEGIVPLLNQLTSIYAVVEDGIVHLDSIQEDAPWNLARISQSDRITGNKTNYFYEESGGRDVTVYIIDSGVYVDHSEFEGRATIGKVIKANSNDKDENGHGTHVAGIVAGKMFGVAKQAEIVAVKVFGADGTGTNSDIIAAIDWVVGDKRGKRGNIINMSLGGPINILVNLAVQSAHDKGFVVVVAAGNSNQNACFSSPASTLSAITVAATNITDTRSYFSNYGPCVDFFAPGHFILSSWIGSPKATRVLSGTSMATPHLAGLAAHFLAIENLTNNQLRHRIQGKAIKGKVQDVKSSPNFIINNGLHIN